RVVEPCLTYYVVVGILFLYIFNPLHHHIIIGIGIGILPDAIHAGVLDPPDAVLDKIFCHMAVTLVQVGHGGYEPAIHHLALVILRGVGVEVHLFHVCGLHILLQVVEPVGGGHLCQSGMVAATVAEDHVHHHLHSFLMGVADQLPVLI